MRSHLSNNFFGKKMAPAEDVSFSALGNWGETEAATGTGDKSQEGFSVQQRYKQQRYKKIQKLFNFQNSDLSTSPSIPLSSPVKPASHSSSSSLLLFFRDTVDTALKNSPKLLSSPPFVVCSSFLESLLSMATGNRRAESTREERKPGTIDLTQELHI